MNLAFDKKRQLMIENLKKLGIEKLSVLNAMEKVPRHLFVAPGLEHQAYDEKALPIGFGQTISHPFTVALMSSALNVKKSEKILEIGTGSGYQAAVLCELGAYVYSIERIKSIAEQSVKNLKKSNFHILQKVGDGTVGWSKYEPYDAIIVTAGAPVVPENLLGQLKANGRLLIPVGDREKQILKMYQKSGSEFEIEEISVLKFVPLLGKQGWATEKKDKI